MDHYRQRIRDLQADMERQLGIKRMREVWREESRFGRGRIKGERSYEDLAPLLAAFDRYFGSELARDERGTAMKREQVARIIAAWAHDAHRNRYGATVDGITKSVVRALKEREAAQADVEAMLSRMGDWTSSKAAALPATELQSLAASLLRTDKN